MTITLEETTTATATLEEQRAAAMARYGAGDRLTDPVGLVFPIPAGYRVPNSPAASSTVDGYIDFLVTGLDEPSYDAEEAGRVQAAILGRVVPVQAAGGQWLGGGSASPGVRLSYLAGQPLRTGISQAQDELVDGDLIAVQGDGIYQYRTTYELQHERGNTLNLICRADGSTPAGPVGESFMGRRWVKVEAVEAPATPEPQTPAAPFPVPEGWRVIPTNTAGQGGFDRDLYVTAVTMDHDSTRPEYASAIGTIRRGRTTNVADKEWYINTLREDLTYLPSFFAEAAILNDVMHSGHHYLLEDGRVLYASPDGMFRDVLTNVAHTYDPSWRRVEVEAVPDPAVAAEEPSDPAVCQYPNERSQESPLLGLAASTNPELNPEPVAGQYYLSWEKESWQTGDFSTLHVFLGEVNGEPTFGNIGSYRINGYGELSRRDTLSVSSVAGLLLSRNYVRAVLPEPAPTANEAVREDLTRELTVLQQRRETYSEALNELAQEQEWCSEFEQIVTPLGFPGRTKTESEVDYMVVVDVTFDAEYDSPSSDVDSALSRALGRDMELSSMNISGTVSLSIQVNGVMVPADAGDDTIRGLLRDRLDDDLVAEELADEIGGDVTVGSWSIDDWDVN